MYLARRWPKPSTTSCEVKDDTSGRRDGSFENRGGMRRGLRVQEQGTGGKEMGSRCAKAYVSARYAKSLAVRVAPWTITSLRGNERYCVKEEGLLLSILYYKPV